MSRKKLRPKTTPQKPLFYSRFRLVFLKSHVFELSLRPQLDLFIRRLREDLDHEDPEPYKLELEAVDSCQPDDIFVAAAHGSNRSGVWGELLTTASKNGGCIGAIVDGSVRDTAPMSKMKFPVFARGTNVYDSLHRQRVTAIDIPVEIGGVTFNPGDLIIADGDGIVVVPQEVEEAVIRAAWEKVHAENITRDAIRNGMSATDAYKKYGVL